MVRALRVAGLLAALPLAQGCLASTVLLHVRADKSVQAVITTRLYESNLRAFDAMFPSEAPRRPPSIEEELPPLAQGQLERMFGTRLRIVSATLDKAPDGGIRTTTIEFADVTQLQILFPPVFGTAGQDGTFGSMAVAETPLLTFSLRPHENGDQLLVLKLPNPKVSNKPDAPVTKFETDSPQERLLKRAIQNMSLKFFVEIEQPLLRTNAPKQDGNRATILDLDLDKMINAMDEPRLRRMLDQGSFQETLWHVGDLPGAIVPTETEIYLEFEGPPRQAAAPAAQAPADTDIYLAPLKSVNGTVEVGAPVNVTNHPSYDNQPFFTPDGRGVLFTSARGAAAGDTSLTRTDIYRYDTAPRTIARVTSTPVGEYSPTVTPDGARISHIRTEADGTQRLASVPMTGATSDAALILPDIKPVGYHAWADDHTVAMFILGGGGAPATLQVADTRDGKARVVASDIGRAVQRMPGLGTSRRISFVQRERSAETVTLTIKELNPQTGEVSVLTRAPDGAREADTAWMPDGTLLVAHGGTLYSWTRGQSGWKEVVVLERLGLRGVTRLAVSPRGDSIALVASASQPR